MEVEHMLKQAVAQAKEKVELLKDVLENIEDEAKIKATAEKLEKAQVDLGKTEGKLEDYLERQKAEKEAAQENSVIDKAHEPKIKVTSPGLYKGFSIERELDAAKDRVNLGVRQRMEERPERAEKLVKHFINLYARAVNSPMAMKAAMEEGTTTEGGFLTPTEERSELLAYIRQNSVALQDCTRIPMNSDSLTIPRENANVTMAFTDEESEATESEPTFEQVTLTANRLDAYSISSNELIQDADNPGGIAGLLLSQFVEAYGQKIDSAVFKGTGSPVSSVLSAGGAGYSQVFGSGSTAFSELLTSDMRKVISKLPTNYTSNAKWYGHRTVFWDLVYGLEDDNGRPLFLDSYVDGRPPTVLGYPVRMPEEIVTTSGSAASTGFLLFGDLRGFYIGDRLTNINLMVDPYSLSTKYQTIFLMFTRWAFAHALPNYYARIVTNS